MRLLFRKIFGIFHFYSYLCSAVPVRPSPRLFDAGDDPGFFVFAKVHKYFDSDNKKAFFSLLFLLSPSPSNIFQKFLASFRRKAYLCRKKKRCQQYLYFSDSDSCFILMIMNQFMSMLSRMEMKQNTMYLL